MDEIKHGYVKLEWVNQNGDIEQAFVEFEKCVVLTAAGAFEHTCRNNDISPIAHEYYAMQRKKELIKWLQQLKDCYEYEA